MKENKGEKDAELAKSTDAHGMPIILRSPGVDKPAYWGKTSIQLVCIEGLQCTKQEYSTHRRPTQSGDTGLLTQPLGERLGSIAALDERRHSFLVLPSQKGLTMTGRSCLVWAAQWEGAHPQASCRGRERLGGLRQGMPGWVCYSGRPRASKPLGQSLAPKSHWVEFILLH